MVSSKTNPKTPEALIRQEKGASNVLEPFHFEQIECIVDSVSQMVGFSVLVTMLVTKLRFVTNELDHTSFEHTKIYCREILIIISGKFLKAMIENFNNWNNFKYLKMNRLNIYSYPTKIQPRSVNTLSITATLTAQDSKF